MSALPSSVAAFAAGTLALLQLPLPPGPAWALALGLLGGAIVAAGVALARSAPRGVPRRHRLALAVGVSGWLLVGFAWAAFDATGRGRRLDPSLHNTDHVLTGRVSGLVSRHDDTLSFEFVTALPDLGRARVALRWYEFDGAEPPPTPGERWRLSVRLRRPRGFSNPGQPGFERRAFQRRLAATGYVRAGPNARLAPRSGPRLDAVRHALSSRLAAALAGQASGPLIVALAVGDRQYLHTDHWRVLRRTGLSHLMAISGLHVGMVALAAYALGAWAGSLVNRGIGTACLAAAVAAGAYASLAGLPLPTQRALIVISVWLGARWLRCDIRRRDGLALALAAILIGDPAATLDAGFWLSFGAVVTILYVTTGSLSAKSMALRVQLALAVGLAPLLIVWFGEVPLAGPIINLLAVPLAGLVLVPGVLVALALVALGSAQGLALAQWLAAGLDAVWPALAWCAALPAATWSPGGAPLIVIALAGAGTLWWLAPPGWPARWLGVVMCTALIAWRAPAPATGAFRLTLLDVGHGTAIVVRTHRHVLVYDTGPLWRSGRDAGERIVLPYFRHRRLGTPDLIVVSHADSDHAGGLGSLRARFPDAPILSGAAGALAERYPAIDDRAWSDCVAGQRWFWDGVAISVVHPARAGRWSGNNASCVLRIATRDACALLSGDIERAAEQALQESPAVLSCAVVVAPHHGSETSSSPAFVALTGASEVLFSSGFANRWKLPRASVVNRWRDAGASIADTGTDGAITVDMVPGQPPRVRSERCARRRLWSEGCAGGDEAAALDPE